MNEEQKNPILKEESENELLKRLEKEGMQKVSALNNKEIEDANKMIKELNKIMEDGTNEFKEKTGRHMTYAEMRAAYG